MGKDVFSFPILHEEEPIESVEKAMHLSEDQGAGLSPPSTAAAESAGPSAPPPAKGEEGGGASSMPPPPPVAIAKSPLTAKATVVDRSKQGGGASSMPPPPPVAIAKAARPSSGRQFQARNKADTERGMTQLEFLRSKEDMSGLKGAPKRRGIPKSEVAQHKTDDDAWVILRGKVYNLTPYMQFHPGGIKILRGVFGKDCTALHDKYHKWVNSDFLLQNCLIGLSE